MKKKTIHIEEFDYPLPDDRIPKFPLPERDHSKLLAYQQGSIKTSVFHKIRDFLPGETTLVFNNTKVIHARLHFFKGTDAKIEVFCLEPVTPAEYNLNFSATRSVTWKCIVGNARKWKSGDLEMPLHVDGIDLVLIARKVSQQGNAFEIEFRWTGGLPFSRLLEVAGKIPIPPYLNRNAGEEDKEVYQTVYSKIEGSVAAPTAGLHFTDDVISALKAGGVDMQEVTLHVGAGTFTPVKVSNVMEHDMHREYFVVEKSVLEALQKSKSIIPVGTTSCRTLESLYWLGVKVYSGSTSLHLSQFEAYELDGTLSFYDALEALLAYVSSYGLSEVKASTEIMIMPGYEFKVIRGLITNFHQPKSTLLLLVSALIGDDWKKVYSYALGDDFRFLSYGDSSILLPY